MIAVEVPEQSIAAFCNKWKIAELSLFGSVLRDDFGPQSDVDVLVTFDEDAPWDLWNVIDAREELSQIFGRQVDLVEKKWLRNPFRRQSILSSHEVVYARPKE